MTVPAKLVTHARKIAPPAHRHWVEFALFAPEQAALADIRRAVRIEVEYQNYRHISGGLFTEEMRESLLDDLK